MFRKRGGRYSVEKQLDQQKTQQHLQAALLGTHSEVSFKMLSMH